VWNNNPGLLGMITGSLTSNSTSISSSGINIINNSGSKNGVLRKADGGGNKKGFKSLTNTLKPIKTFPFNLGDDGNYFIYDFKIMIK